MSFEYSIIGLCALLAISISWTRSPFMSLMFAVLLFLNASIVLLYLGFEFMALVNLIVYVGALAVLFLFVIMLLEIPSTILRSYNRGWSTLALSGFLACRVFAYTSPFINSDKANSFAPHVQSVSLVPTFEAIQNIGHAFYIYYADVLVLNSLVLTVALFGALILAKTAPSS